MRFQRWQWAFRVVSLIILLIAFSAVAFGPNAGAFLRKNTHWKRTPTKAAAAATAAAAAGVGVNIFSRTTTLTYRSVAGEQRTRFKWVLKLPRLLCSICQVGKLLSPLTVKGFYHIALCVHPLGGTVKEIGVSYVTVRVSSSRSRFSIISVT